MINNIIKSIFPNLTKGIVEVVEQFQEPKKRAQEIEKLLVEQKIVIEETYNNELNQRTQIIQAEMQQGDKWTKRARPIIVYFGLFAIFIVHILTPNLAYWLNRDLPLIELPSEFWWAFGTVVSVYSTGRTIEKFKKLKP